MEESVLYLLKGVVINFYTLFGDGKRGMDYGYERKRVRRNENEREGEGRDLRHK
jgi:hypothetical protein